MLTYSGVCFVKCQIMLTCSSARSLKKERLAANGYNGTPTDAAALHAEAWRRVHFARAVIAEPDRITRYPGLTRMHHRILFFVAPRRA